jgi:hypothetical protein
MALILHKLLCGVFKSPDVTRVNGHIKCTAAAVKALVTLAVRNRRPGPMSSPMPVG